MLEHTSKERNTAKVLKLVKQAFSSLEFWLHAGSLLGAVRENGRIISRDNDVDLFAWRKDMNKFKSALPRLKKPGLYVVLNEKLGRLSIDPLDNRFFPINLDFLRKDYGYAWKLNFSKRRFDIKNFLMTALERGVNISSIRIHADQTVATKIKDFSARLPAQVKRLITNICWRILKALNWYEPYVFPINFFEHLRHLPFLGQQILAPSPPEEFLRYNYGDDWRIPKQWCYYVDARTAAKGKLRQRLWKKF